MMTCMTKSMLPLCEMFPPESFIDREQWGSFTDVNSSTFDLFVWNAIFNHHEGVLYKTFLGLLINLRLMVVVVYLFSTGDNSSLHFSFEQTKQICVIQIVNPFDAGKRY